MRISLSKLATISFNSASDPSIGCSNACHVKEKKVKKRKNEIIESIIEKTSEEKCTYVRMESIVRIRKKKITKST